MSKLSIILHNLPSQLLARAMLWLDAAREAVHDVARDVAHDAAHDAQLRMMLCNLSCQIFHVLS